MARKLENWLKTLGEYVEDTEAPRLYWLWGGIFTICAALQRKVWIPYGLDNIYPNLYLLIIANPGERKAGPPTLAKRMLEEIQVPVAVDSSSKRALTEELAETTKTQSFPWKGKQRSMASLAIVSKEMSSLLAVDPKGIIEVLTDLYDSHETWKYKTSGKGEDFLYNVCVSCFIVTTSTWFMNNLPMEAIGGGYTSRHAIITGEKFYKSVPWPPPLSDRLYRKLVTDLNHIRADLVGEIEVTPEAKTLFTSWYDKIPKLRETIHEEKVQGFLNRMHVITLKVATALHTAYSDELVILEGDMREAIRLVSDTIKSSIKAFSGHGSSPFGPQIQRIMGQIRTLGEVTEKELLAMNFSDVGTLTVLREILATIEGMGAAKLFPARDGRIVVRWIGMKEE